MVKYYLPGLFEFFELYTVFVDMFQKENYKFRDCEIGAIFGSPNRIIWNGGRVKNAPPVDLDMVKKWSDEKNISCALTFTNCLINEEHLNNIYCNDVARLFESERNAIIIHSPILEDYLRNNYSKYNFVSSTTKCINQVDRLMQEFEKDYDRVVLDYNFNKDLKMLKDLPEEYRQRSELLINAVCYPYCPQRPQHYYLISQSALGIERNEKPFECNAMHRQFWQVLKNPNTINVEEIYEVYEPLGFQHFKIEGRTASVKDLIEILVYYMVKPEYQMEIRQRLNLIF